MYDGGMYTTRFRETQKPPATTTLPSCSTETAASLYWPRTPCVTSCGNVCVVSNLSQDLPCMLGASEAGVLLKGFQYASYFSFSSSGIGGVQSETKTGKMFSFIDSVFASANGNLGNCTSMR